jgi:hypothetical protein
LAQALTPDAPAGQNILHHQDELIRLIQNGQAPAAT